MSDLFFFSFLRPTQFCEAACLTNTSHLRAPERCSLNAAPRLVGASYVSTSHVCRSGVNIHPAPSFSETFLSDFNCLVLYTKFVFVSSGETFVDFLFFSVCQSPKKKRKKRKRCRNVEHVSRRLTFSFSSGSNRVLLANTMAADGHRRACCSHPVSSPGVHQTLDEMDFERGLCRTARSSFLKPPDDVSSGLTHCRSLVCRPGWGPGEGQIFGPEGRRPKRERFGRVHGSGECVKIKMDDQRCLQILSQNV